MSVTQKTVGNWPKLEWVQAIRDPIWNYVVITEVEQRLLQTEVFSKLRGIKQLGFAYLSFPGAMHSRFEHSLGVMHVSDQLLKYLTSREGGISVEESSHRQLLRIAALLHDVGHAPFSHAIEDLLTVYPDIWAGIPDKVLSELNNYTSDGSNPDRHETFTEYLICTNQEIKNVLKTWLMDIDKGLTPISEDDQDAFIRDVIARLAVGKKISNPEKYSEYKDLSTIFRNIMSGDIDADKIDYLARDNYYCGLPYSLDINWLRKRIVVEKGNIFLLPEGIKFVIAIVLSRYSLFTEVHQDKWDSFTKLKVIEILYEKLKAESSKKRADTIKRLFTEWQDSNLLSYLFDKNENSLRKILTTEYPLAEIERLKFEDSHPYIRQAMEVLAEHPNFMPEFQNNLRKLTNFEDIYVTIRRVKSPGFNTVVKGGSLLRNDILRGISEESLKNLHVVVFGSKDKCSLRKDEALNNVINNLTVQGEQIDEFVQDLAKDPLKKLLAYLIIQSYRTICNDCARKNEILASDFVLLVMESIADISVDSNKKVEVTRQEIYKIAQAINKLCIRSGIKINGELDMDEDEEEITPSFYREIRKYEQLGLLTYTRKTERLPEEDKIENSNGEKSPTEQLPQEEEVENSNNEKYVFRFDRRFVLSRNGHIKLQKMEDLSHNVPEYKQYIALWKIVRDCAESIRPQIELIIEEGKSF